MKYSTKQILMSAYAAYQHSQGPVTVQLSELDNCKIFLQEFRILEESGLVRKSMSALNCIIFEITAKGIEFVESPAENAPNPTSTVINIGTSNGPVANTITTESLISNVSPCTELGEIESLISQKPYEQLPELSELLDILKRMETSSEPIQRGMLSKFADVLKKNQDIFAAVGGFITRLVIKTIQGGH